ncbi:UPF0481 protein At3g47200-like [Hibiscus syriacus]|uniref:UPF0481 protein At3g47200-like n=1 Tax=Hibiscus syriacus TaxID=106335 RepID=UPI001920B771|nr:UPF0481 protein At3g47200-like [Hibiscus syriacus]
MENHEPGTENNTSDENLDHLAKDIESTLKFVKSSKRPAVQHCIIRSVNPLLRRVNEAAYRPLFVIIGPLRCYTSLLEPMELQKRIYLASFLQRPGVGASLNEFCKLITASAPEIRSRYEETYYRRCDFKAHQIQQNIPPSDDNLQWFIEMVLADAAFIIELFLRIYHKEGQPESEIDFVFDSPGKIYDIRRDLFLAHNQLPLFVLKQIYDLAFGNNPDHHPSFIHLSCNFFYQYFNQNISIHDLFQPNQPHVDFIAKLEGAKHFTDLLRTLQLQHSFQNPGSNSKSFSCKPMFKCSSLFPSGQKTEENSDLESGRVQGKYLYSATLLREAGVKFRVSSSRCLLDIKFNKTNGELSIPPLKLDESTEPFFRNIMGWEQSYYPEETHVCDYVFLMEYLIKSSDDVDLLVRKRIIINQLGSHTAVVTLFNDLCKHIPPTENNRYSETFRDLNAYNSVRRHGWMAKLRLLYFSSLWKSVATLAATALLLLTLTQTICALISL